MTTFARRTWLVTTTSLIVWLTATLAEVFSQAKAADPPSIGSQAADFKLNTPAGDVVQLSGLLKQGPVVIVVLRGYPGYQCPACTAQAGQFLASAKKFAAARATVVMVYPGAGEGLKQHATDFIRGKTFPQNCYLVLDPDYEFTSVYHLRWDVARETAYPSTFVVSPNGQIQFAKISQSHGGRASADEVLEALSAK